VGTVVLDAGVVIGWLDAADAHHRASSLALDEHAGDDLRVPASAWAEALVRHVRAGSVDRARNAVRDAEISVAAIDEAVAEEAAELRARHASVRLPDALVIAYAETIHAEELLTTDARWARFSSRVRVVG
jgi:predicted nucleic acid-binding protein